MDQETEDLWVFIVKQRNLRSELVAVRECQSGEMVPLACVLAEYGLPKEFIVTVCLSIKNPRKPQQLTKRFAIGHEIEKRLRHRPREKKQIVRDVATGRQIVGDSNKAIREKTANNYHDHFLRELKKRGWTRADLDQFRNLLQDPSSH